MLLYLEDPIWDPSWGGQLRIFEPSTDEAGEERVVDIQPDGGTLVLMRSDRVPHEVLETRRTRRCLVGWFRTLGVVPE